jgi:drug/metabolite transporter (DMT)-like permease
MYIPILGALALATGNILERVVLKKRKVKITLYNTLVFLATTLVMLPFIYFFWKATPEAYTIKSLSIFGIIIIFSIIANLFTYYSMKRETLSNLEPAKMLEPLFVVLLAILFSFFIDRGLYERNLNAIVPAIIAALALIFSHVKKHHLAFNKYFIAAIFGSLFFATELILSRLILDYYSPITFYFLRCSSIFVISLILFRPKIINQVNTKVTLEILATGVMWFIFRVAVYYGYLQMGIVSTTLLIMLAPVFIYAFAKIFLKEKLALRNIVASIIIIACVLYVILI